MASDLFSRVYYPWRALPGGIDVSVIPIRVSRSIGRAEEELLDMHLEGLKSFIKREAEGFGEPVQADSFRKLTGLLRDGRAHAYLVTVDWTNAAKELVLPREIRDQLTARQNGSNYTKKEIVGGAVEHPTVFLSKGQDGNITFWPGIHGEDSYIDPEASDLVRAITQAADEKPNPRGFGLGTFSTVERIKLISHRNPSLFGGLIARGRTAEHSNTASPRMAGIYAKLKTTVEFSDENSIMVLPPDLNLKTYRSDLDSGEVRIFRLGAQEQDGRNLDNIFGVSWTLPGGRKIVGGVALGISSYTGDDVIRFYLRSDFLPDSEEIVRSAVARILYAAQNEVHLRGWVRWDSVPQNLYRMHVLHEPAISKAISSIGGVPRRLGSTAVKHVLYANETDFRDIPSDVWGGFRPGRARALQYTWDPANENGAPVPRRRRATIPGVSFHSRDAAVSVAPG